MQVKSKITKLCSLALSILFVSGCAGPAPVETETPSSAPSYDIVEETKTPVKNTPTPTEVPELEDYEILDKRGNIINLRLNYGFKFFKENFLDAEPWNFDWNPVKLIIPETPCMAVRLFTERSDGEYGVRLPFPDPEAIRANDGTDDLLLSDEYELDCRIDPGDTSMADTIEALKPGDYYFTYTVRTDLSRNDVVRTFTNIAVTTKIVTDADEFCSFVEQGYYNNEHDALYTDDSVISHYLDENTAGEFIQTPSGKPNKVDSHLYVVITKYLEDAYIGGESNTGRYAVEIKLEVGVSNDNGHSQKEVDAAVRDAAEFVFGMYGLKEDLAKIQEGNITPIPGYEY